MLQLFANGVDSFFIRISVVEDAERRTERGIAPDYNLTQFLISEPTARVEEATETRKTFYFGNPGVDS